MRTGNQSRIEEGGAPVESEVTVVWRQGEADNLSLGGVISQLTV